MDVFITTGDVDFTRYTIKRYLGTIHGKATVSDLYLSSTNERLSSEYALQIGQAERIMISEAKKIGANAIIGLRMEYIKATGVLVTLLYGTAVQIDIKQN